MTTDPPPAGSAWAARCPDAYPYEWFVALGLAGLPPGFTRFASADEGAVIIGGVAAREAEAAPGQVQRAVPLAPHRGGPGRPPAAGSGC